MILKKARVGGPGPLNPLVWTVIIADEFDTKFLLFGQTMKLLPGYRVDPSHNDQNPNVSPPHVCVTGVGQLRYAETPAM